MRGSRGGQLKGKLQSRRVVQQPLFVAQAQIDINQAQIESHPLSFRDRLRFFVLGHAAIMFRHQSSAKQNHLASNTPTNAFGTTATLRQFFASSTFAAHLFTSSRVI